MKHFFLYLMIFSLSTLYSFGITVDPPQTFSTGNMVVPSYIQRKSDSSSAPILQIHREADFLAVSGNHVLLNLNIPTWNLRLRLNRHRGGSVTLPSYFVLKTGLYVNCTYPSFITLVAQTCYGGPGVTGSEDLSLALLNIEHRSSKETSNLYGVISDYNRDNYFQFLSSASDGTHVLGINRKDVLGPRPAKKWRLYRPIRPVTVNPFLSLGTVIFETFSHDANAYPTNRMALLIGLTNKLTDYKASVEWENIISPNTTKAPFTSGVFVKGNVKIENANLLVGHYNSTIGVFKSTEDPYSTANINLHEFSKPRIPDSVIAYNPFMINQWGDIFVGHTMPDKMWFPDRRPINIIDDTEGWVLRSFKKFVNSTVISTAPKSVNGQGQVALKDTSSFPLDDDEKTREHIGKEVKYGVPIVFAKAPILDPSGSFDGTTFEAPSSGYYLLFVKLVFILYTADLPNPNDTNISHIGDGHIIIRVDQKPKEYQGYEAIHKYAIDLTNRVAVITTRNGSAAPLTFSTITYLNEGQKVDVVYELNTPDSTFQRLGDRTFTALFLGRKE